MFSSDEIHLFTLKKIPRHFMSEETLKPFARALVRSRLPLGVEDRRIPDGSFEASSSWDRNHGPKRSRLNMLRRRSRRGAWSARHNNRRQWLQVDIGASARVIGFGTQGRQDANQWVTSFKISSSRNGLRFVYYKEKGRVKVSRSSLPLLCAP